MRADELGPEVARVRERDEGPLFADQRAEEDVVHYRRRVTLDPAVGRARAPEMSAVQEILRLNVGRWLRRMDEPVRALRRLGDDGVVQHIPAAKTYRVTMVVAWGGAAEREHQKLSIVLTRDGIVRVDSPAHEFPSRP
jgi:hypothetical protein